HASSLHPFPTRRSSDLIRRGFMLAAMIALLGAGDSLAQAAPRGLVEVPRGGRTGLWAGFGVGAGGESFDLLDGVGYSGELYKPRSEEHTSELQSRFDLV